MGRRKRFIGTVISDKMQKTRVVKITEMSKHPKYGRIVKKYNKFKVHDENNSAQVGDTVRIEETKPLSKDKRFRLLEIIKKAQHVHLTVSEELS